MRMPSESGMDWFLNQAGRYPLLTHEEELLLGRQVQKWMPIRDIENPTPAQRRTARAGRRAYDRFFTGNLRLVVAIAKRFMGRRQHLEFTDLVQDGCMGLSRAIEMYDPARGYKFSTYSYWWIRQAINRGISTTDRTIRLPAHVYDLMPKLKRWLEEFQREHKRSPTLRECCDEFDVKEAQTMRRYLEHIGRVASLNATANCVDGDASELIDLVGTDLETAEAEAERDIEVERMMNCLELIDNPEAREVLATVYGLNESREGMSRSRAGQSLGVTRARVEKVERETLEQLRRLMGVAA